MRLRPKFKASYNPAVNKRISNAIDAALYQEAVDIMSESVQQCPVDTGRLRQTAYVAPPRRHRVEIGYGTNYAIYVHERTELRHKVGKAKFLQDPVNAARAGFSERMASRVAKFVQSGASFGGGQFPTSPKG